MDLANYKVTYKIQPRPWGEEVMFQAINIKSNVVFRDVIVFKETPKEAEALAAIALKLDRCEAALLEREIIDIPPSVVTKESVEAYLREQGINKTIEELKVLSVEAVK